jgi:hypothetical protein
MDEFYEKGLINTDYDLDGDGIEDIDPFTGNIIHKVKWGKPGKGLAEEDNILAHKKSLRSKMAMMMNVKISSHMMGYSGPHKINDEIISKKEELKKSYDELIKSDPASQVEVKRELQLPGLRYADDLDILLASQPKRPILKQNKKKSSISIEEEPKGSKNASKPTTNTKILKKKMKKRLKEIIT